MDRESQFRVFQEGTGPLPHLSQALTSDSERSRLALYAFLSSLYRSS